MQATRPATAPAEPRRFRTDVLMMGSSRAAVMVLGFAQSVIVARALGPSGRGAVAAAITFALILLQAGTLGLTAANPYFVARDRLLHSRLIGNSLWLALGLGVLLGGMGGLAKLLAPDIVRDVSWLELTLALGALPGALAAMLLQSILLGEGRTPAYNALAVAMAGIPVVGVVALSLTTGLNVNSALAVILVTHYAAAGLSLVVLRADGLRFRFDTDLARSMVAYSLRTYVITVLGFLLLRVDVLLVNGYFGSFDAGIYAVTVAIADGLYLLPLAVGFNLFSRVSRGTDAGMTGRVLVTLAVSYAFICAVSLVLAGPVVRTFFGNEFANAIGLYYWLVPGVYALGLGSVIAQYYAGKGSPPVLIRIWGAGLCLNLGINVIWLEDHGVYVASLASSVSYALVLVLLIGLFVRDGRRGTSRPSKPLPAGGASRHGQ
jgi:O-antigen/teichoic acid export membrane protein